MLDLCYHHYLQSARLLHSTLHSLFEATGQSSAVSMALHSILHSVFEAARLLHYGVNRTRVEEGGDV